MGCCGGWINLILHIYLKKSPSRDPHWAGAERRFTLERSGPAPTRIAVEQNTATIASTVSLNLRLLADICRCVVRLVHTDPNGGRTALNCSARIGPANYSAKPCGTALFVWLVDEAISAYIRTPWNQTWTKINSPIKLIKKTKFGIILSQAHSQFCAMCLTLT